ncbi:hypothetical protein [Ammoniphilus sp. 3BR4]|uniref:hypothetical protein n=1 Tax=Ammoniphilus sp. 3BR4 TaxID=3158265 RepID=UPI003465A2BD
MAKKRKHKVSPSSAKRLDRLESSLKNIRMMLQDTRKDMKHLNNSCTRIRSKPRISNKKKVGYTPYNPDSIPKQSSRISNPWYPGKSDIQEMMKESTIHSLFKQEKKKESVASPPQQPPILGELNQMLNILQHPAFKSLFPWDHNTQQRQQPTRPNQAAGPNINQVLKLLENPAVQSLLKNVL